MSSFFNQFKSPLIATVVISLIVGGLSGLIFGTLAVTWIPQTESLLSNVIKKTVVSQKEPAENGPLAVFDEDAATIKVVKRAAPAVVSIIVTKDVSKYVSVSPFPFDNDFFKQFGLPFEFKIEPAPSQPKSQKPNKQQVGGGSGFAIRSDGLILTNKHVMADSEAEYTVVTNNGQQYSAKVLAADPFLDIALVKIEAKDLPVLTLGDSSKLQIGQTVIAIGNTLGQYRNTVTKGVVSGINRRVVAGTGRGANEVIEEAIQTDAAINPGNSGGPLLNISGEVIGINTAISLEGQLIGFAIPINQVKRVVESVEKYGRVVRPWLGIRYLIINKEIADKNQLPVDYGALILRGATQTELAVVPGSPADKAGLMENDIILEANGAKIDEEHSLAVLIGKFKVGDELTLKILRQGENKEIKVKLEELKSGNG